MKTIQKLQLELPSLFIMISTFSSKKKSGINGNMVYLLTQKDKMIIFRRNANKKSHSVNNIQLLNQF